MNENPEMITRVPNQGELEGWYDLVLYNFIMNSAVLCPCGEPARLRARSTEGTTLVECYECLMNAGTRGTTWSLL